MNAASRRSIASTANCSNWPTRCSTPRSSPRPSPEAFSAALDKLLTHIVRHFADEEAILAQHGYKDLKKHRLIHAALIARASELRASVSAGKTTLGDLVEFVANTVVARHLFKEDRKYFSLFKVQR